jgi:LPXTG-motif cell wall-anchored protein
VKPAGVLLCALGAVVLVAGVRPAGAATEEERIPVIGASTPAPEACTASFPANAFEKVASEGSVAPGQAVAVDVTWRPAWHQGDKVDILGCVAANGRFVDGTVERGVDNNGLWVHKFAVPASAAKDVLVCQAAVVIGPGSDGKAQAERSDPDCFTVAATAAKAEPAPAAANPAPAAGLGKETTAEAAQPASTPAQTRTAATPPAAPTASAPPRAAAAAPAPAAAAAKPPATQLPHTGARERLLVTLAGVLLIVGGWALGVSARRRPQPAFSRRSTLE